MTLGFGCVTVILYSFSASKVLKDDDGNEKLAQLGIENNAKILASRVCAEEGKSLKEELLAEDKRSQQCFDLDHNPFKLKSISKPDENLISYGSLKL
ncbi:PREDICTED: NEDD8 ultimate buster 1 [Prunus dulcis]|uniref:PREDICTED: NEDD8 ultimate buster 1 n=1 Tax=Prunus dulcis TaxID=3755 RepID=A0A5E4GBR4_PRUDU|nr:hypothetical protein L3X38_042872 [Prunus dulcis]VVA37335.1 PREDICTED: NEDD8 ultimate buster 1 [Prunus dulcis]